MNSKTFLSKTMSLVASLALAIGGSLIAAQPASAAPGDAFIGSIEGSSALSVFWNNCSSLSGTASTTGFSVYKNNSQSPLTLTGASIPTGGSNNILLLTLPSSAAANDLYKLVFDNTSSGLICGSSGSTKPASISSADNLTTTSSPANQQQTPQASYAMTNAPSFTISNGVATANDGVWSGTGGSITRWWVLCDSAKQATTTMPAMDCHPIYSAATGGSMEQGPTLNIQTVFYKPGAQNAPRVAMNFAEKYFMLYVSIGGANATTATVAGANVGLAQNQNNNVTAVVERSIPVPALQAPILNSLAPKMSGGFSSNGGRLVLKDVKPTDISSVMLNGKKVEVITSKSGAALRIPAGAGAGDLQFTMADGTVINVANAVKITQSQVDPKLVDLNNLPTFKSGSVAVPRTIKAALLKNKEVILDSVNAKCVGYASSNTASARATALARASNVCGVITDMNENIEPLIKVLVNKAVAKKSPVKYQTW